ncbi:hypothetical protein OUZ56_017165 [Daphnia magna]|uniref:Uncharacterized protein n=1 Tax=Daphnia magna TaxID=35525 RepID=A0ABR0ASA5_9CRUS|nr:hypothetical protein OUZ56_017165 [Daphnia magna]
MTIPDSLFSVFSASTECSSDRVFFFTVLAEVQRTGARLNFSPSVSTVWFGDYYFSTYSGYAKYH